MTNAVSTKSAAGGALASLAALKFSLANVAASTPMRITEPFMRMGTDGVWIYGAENIEVEEGSKWAINPLSVRHGYSCWSNYPAKAKKKNELQGESMVPASHAKPSRDTLQTFTDAAYGAWEWKDQVSFTMMCVSGEDKGVVVLYKTSSAGGLNAAGGILEAIIKQLDDDPSAPVPAVTLNSDSYQHKSYGKTYFPVLDIVEWHGLPEGGMVDVQAEEDDAKAEEETKAPAKEEPARRRRPTPAAAASAVEEPEQEDVPEEKPAAPAGDVRRRRTRG